MRRGGYHPPAIECGMRRGGYHPPAIECEVDKCRAWVVQSAECRVQSLVGFAHSEIRLWRVKSLRGEIFTFGKCEIFASRMLMKILRSAKSTSTLHS